MIDKVIRDLENISEVSWAETVDQAIRDLKKHRFVPSSVVSDKVACAEGQRWELRRIDRNYTKQGWIQALETSQTTYDKVLTGKPVKPSTLEMMELTFKAKFCGG